MIDRMKKLTLAAVKQDADSLSEELVFLSCVEVEPLNDSLLSGKLPSGLSAVTVADEISDKETRASLIASAISLLSPFGTGKKSLFKISPSYTLDQYRDSSVLFERASGICDNSFAKKDKLDELATEKNLLQNEKASISPWLSLSLPLGFSETRSTLMIKGVVANSGYEGLVSTISREIPESCVEKITEDETNAYICVYTLKENRENALRFLTSCGFSKIDFSQNDEPKKRIRDIEERLVKIDEEREKTVCELSELAKDRPILERVYDRLNLDLEKLYIKRKLVCTENVVLMSAWIPERETKRLESVLSKYQCCYELEDPSQDDDVPVSLKNNAFASPFESVLSLYSYPAYHGIDPTFPMSIFYFVIFGLILADVGYGLLMSVGCLVLLKLLKPKGTMEKMLRMFAICGISCIVAGVLFGGYFGDLPAAVAKMFGVTDFPEMALLLNPVTNPMGYLILSLAVGAVHLLVGMGINAYMLIRDGRAVDAICDVGMWYLFFAGIACFFLFPTFGKYVLIAGVAGLILTQGRHEKNIFMKLGKGIFSLYDVVSYVSDILSYSRILALGLSGAIIGQVVNIIGTLGGPNIVGIIILILAFLLGHTLNLALSLLGAFVHTARLQYIEFFNKFYFDGGRPFAPSRINTKYTRIS